MFPDSDVGEITGTLAKSKTVWRNPASVFYGGFGFAAEFADTITEEICENVNIIYTDDCRRDGIGKAAAADCTDEKHQSVQLLSVFDCRTTVYGAEIRGIQ